jgi:two-component system nitrate/nitrite sensor histidine kinase NarX
MHDYTAPMKTQARWHLGAKLALVAAPFVATAMLLIAATLWVSWQLDGGAAALNEAGRMRMQVYRLSLSVSTGDSVAMAREVSGFESSLALLRDGDPQRPLFMPSDDTIRDRFAGINSEWKTFRDRWTVGGVDPAAGLRGEASAFAAHADSLVTAIEAHLSRWTAVLHLLQAALMALVVLGAAVLLFTGYMYVLEDEFGTLARRFQRHGRTPAVDVPASGSRVAEKTAELEEKRERLESAVQRHRRSSQCRDARGTGRRASCRSAGASPTPMVWRCAGPTKTNQRYLMLAARACPQSMLDAEHCLRRTTATAAPRATGGARVIPIRDARSRRPDAALRAGRFRDHRVGADPAARTADGRGRPVLPRAIELSDAERSLLEALTAHLASGMENLRLNALEKEAAVSQERGFLARELHDSIAQSLAFLKIQVQLMRDAWPRRPAAHGQGCWPRSSCRRARELWRRARAAGALPHPHQRRGHRAGAADHAAQVRAPERHEGHAHHARHGMPLAPDLQIQVLHIVQEALSNVRKHAGASAGLAGRAAAAAVALRGARRRRRLRPRHATTAQDETHVGLRIMAERAAAHRRRLEVQSARAGTSVVLTLPTATPPAATASRHLRRRWTT